MAVLQNRKVKQSEREGDSARAKEVAQSRRERAMHQVQSRQLERLVEKGYPMMVEVLESCRTPTVLARPISLAR